MTLEDTYTLDEVSAQIGITRRTLYNYVKAGQLKAVKLGKQWRVSIDELQAFIQRGTEPNYMAKLGYIRPDRRKGSEQ